ncbi:DUF4334 domain-containing protein [Pedobacter gandavensis]|uniref:DUF4334 domain-containing protein n=1 Tax=Pedobacter gandavensis TaxID=2679963 RepID=UPI00292E4B19|nr:DUF4334 domain-containing protein [Pedobacter gandavensis]
MSTGFSAQEALKSRKISSEEATRLFDNLEPVSIEFMLGRWKGEELYTGNPADGILETTGWAGKTFENAENVFPLVFFTDSSKTETFNVDPLIAMSPDMATKYAGKTLGEIREVVETQASKARLRMVEFKGKVSATMIYDNLPINDIFRKIDDNMVIGVMDFKGGDQPYYFLLIRLGNAQ